MSNEREIKQFSLNLYYIMEGDKEIILDSKYNELGSYIQEFNQEKKKFHLFKYNFSELSIPQLQEYLMFQLEVPIICHAEKIFIDGFPMKRELTNQILDIFKNDYKDSFKIVDFEETAGLCDIEIIISQPKRTHYIQQAYLRNFSSNKTEWLSTNNKKKARIFVYDKLKEQIIIIGNTDSEKNFGQRIESIAFEDYFYSLSLEKYMADNLERQIPTIFDKLFTTKTISAINSSEKEILVRYLILTWNRPTEAREHMKESFEKGIVEAIKMNPELEVPKNANPVMNEDYLRYQHESQIIKFLDKSSDLYLVDRIMNFKWLLIQAKNNNFYFTSDNPIIFYNSFYEKQKSRGNDFIANKREKTLSKLKNDEKVGDGMILTSEHPERRPGVKGIEIYFPISPLLCILLVDWQKQIDPYI